MNCLLNALMNVGNAHIIYTLQLLLNLAMRSTFSSQTLTNFWLQVCSLPDQSQVPSYGPADNEMGKSLNWSGGHSNISTVFYNHSLLLLL